jgi:CDP-2,3-bis-(O-geranylgeranyl)-sn-glycerol synthase
VSVEFALLQAFWFFLPAYVANPLAVLFGGGRPIDGGRILSDGYRLFGDGKTWRGLVGGIAGGIVVGLVQWGLAAAFAPELTWGTLPAGLGPLAVLPSGALLGDLLGAYVKRRAGKARGAPVPGLDWYDFYLGAFALLILADYRFFLDHYVAGEAIYGFAFVTVITPVLHRVVNVLGFRLGKKDVPW